jgi:hypothetical protein
LVINLYLARLGGTFSSGDIVTAIAGQKTGARKSAANQQKIGTDGAIDGIA